jgi:hypothetical protein
VLLLRVVGEEVALVGHGKPYSVGIEISSI